MSGGVDSSVSAALLKKAGYDVTGVFIKVWQPDWIECNWREERLDAMRAAAHLDIPFVTLDLEKEYKQGVIDYMIAEYRAGRTPNPDVMCNREIKFGAFWKWAKGQGADYIATGHYAQTKDGKLFMGADANKDQSYFLWTLTPDDLKHVLFPVGHLIKPQVRKLAAKFGLPNAEKKDSQGLCFMGKIDVKEFLQHYIPAVPGKVLNEAGQEIGTHPGALLFTIGERRGFSVAHTTPNDAAYYVIGKDAEANTITVSNRKDIAAESAGSARVKLSRTNWIGSEPHINHVFQGRVRYRQPLENVRLISAQGNTAELEFEHAPEAVAPGQSFVAYDGERCLGGGIVE
ncbi:MAG: tRNA (5-methylaminomethyl-2-thiouridylate)-methyltransferase, tRNA-specific 2-thiouridylase [Candidatus Parcubacteria bacterium]|nr:tRNA (5-methylaminomethyl-2-thiouridylate)-methyltransferase, tRNA-specific 2-thiouridylase [Candidatus Parcubacteria bacterium]